MSDLDTLAETPNDDELLGCQLCGAPADRGILCGTCYTKVDVQPDEEHDEAEQDAKRLR